MSRALGGKWFGSDELTLRFVRDATRMHPHAPARAALLVDGHEAWDDDMTPEQALIWARTPVP